MIYNLLHVPNSRLSEISRPVLDTEFGPALAQHMENMITTMYAYGGIGLAGIQIGDARRILVAEIGQTIGQQVIAMVNPEIEVIDESKQTINEACLSVPMFDVEIERPAHIRVKFKTPLGEPQEIELSGIQATIILHEKDHLEGETILDSAGRVSRTFYLKKTKKFKYNHFGSDFQPQA